MDIRIAAYREKYFKEVFDVVHSTIEDVYPLYYPREAVDFFHGHHSFENMRKDIPAGKTIILIKNGKIVSTGSVVKNEIKRFFVLPVEQSLGFGKTMLIELEKIVSGNGYSEAILDASLSSFNFYRHFSFELINYKIDTLPGGSKLCYFEMRKLLDVK